VNKEGRRLQFEPPPRGIEMIEMSIAGLLDV
jgi:hypothetical protein